MVARRGGTARGVGGWRDAGGGEEWTREARVGAGSDGFVWDSVRRVVDREATSTEEVRRLLLPLVMSAWWDCGGSRMSRSPSFSASPSCQVAFAHQPSTSSLMLSNVSLAFIICSTQYGKK